MRRWIVYRAGRYAWTANLEGELPRELFHTWREALAYADRMARTREVVLPRLDYKEPLSLHIATMKGELTLISSIADSDYYDWETGPEPFAKFGALLLALAEQEEQICAS